MFSWPRSSLRITIESKLIQSSVHYLITIIAMKQIENELYIPLALEANAQNTSRIRMKSPPMKANHMGPNYLPRPS